MKIGVIGTGAVGGYFGGFLKRAGHDVVFFARGENLKIMRETGLKIETEKESFLVQGEFTDDYKAFRQVDLLLFAVKSTATKEVAEKLHPVLKETCLIMTLQNGVDNEEILALIFGKERIISGAAYIQVGVKEPGAVKQIGVPPRLVIGGLDEALAEEVDLISSRFNASNIVTVAANNSLEMKWKKLLWNVTFNPLTALIETNVGAIFDDQGLKQTALTICKEAISVARKMGYNIDGNFHEVVFAQGEYARNHKTSMLQDKLNGRRMELESICGYIVKKGKELELATPVLETIYRLLDYQEKSRTGTQ